jgi:hypothetical protein
LRRFWHVRVNRLGGNLGSAGCPVLPVEGIGLDVIQAPNRGGAHPYRSCARRRHSRRRPDGHSGGRAATSAAASALTRGNRPDELAPDDERHAALRADHSVKGAERDLLRAVDRLPMEGSCLGGSLQTPRHESRLRDRPLRKQQYRRICPCYRRSFKDFDKPMPCAFPGILGNNSIAG